MLEIIAENLLPFLIGVVVSGVTSYFICKRANAVPTAGVVGNLITNGKAIDMINRYRSDVDDKTSSGHIELGVLLGYIELMKTRCDAIGQKLAGLEYYFAKYGPDPSNPQSSAVSELNDYNRNTIVIFPTYEDEGGNFIPFDPFQSTQSTQFRVVDFNDEANLSLKSSPQNTMYNNPTSNLVVLDKLHMSPPRQPTF